MADDSLARSLSPALMTVGPLDARYSRTAFREGYVGSAVSPSFEKIEFGCFRWPAGPAQVLAMANSIAKEISAGLALADVNGRAASAACAIAPRPALATWGRRPSPQRRRPRSRTHFSIGDPVLQQVPSNRNHLEDRVRVGGVAYCCRTTTQTCGSAREMERPTGSPRRVRGAAMWSERTGGRLDHCHIRAGCAREIRSGRRCGTAHDEALRRSTLSPQGPSDRTRKRNERNGGRQGDSHNCASLSHVSAVHPAHLRPFTAMLHVNGCPHVRFTAAPPGSVTQLHLHQNSDAMSVPPGLHSISDACSVTSCTVSSLRRKQHLRRRKQLTVCGWR